MRSIEQRLEDAAGRLAALHDDLAYVRGRRVDCEAARDDWLAAALRRHEGHLQAAIDAWLEHLGRLRREHLGAR